MIEQCEKCKHKEILNGGIIGCLYMGADCRKGELFEPITNADRIRAMSDEELYDLLKEVYNAGCDDATAYGWGSIRNSFEWTKEWLQQPAE